MEINEAAPGAGGAEKAAAAHVDLKDPPAASPSDASAGTPQADITIDPPAQELTVGVARCGAAAFGIPIQSLAEVARVTQLNPLFQPAAHLQGGLELRGTLVPIFDLAGLSGAARATDAKPAFAAILRHGGRLMGLGVDQIDGLLKIDTTRFETVSDKTRTAPPSGLRGSVLCGEQVVTVVSPEALFERDDLISAPHRAFGKGTKARQSPSDTDQTVRANGQEPMLIFSAGGADYALAATAIQGTVPRIKVEENALTSGPCLGSITYHKQRVPVLQTPLLTGLGTLSAPGEAEIVVLRLAEGARVGLAVDRIERMRNADHADLRPAPPTIDSAGGVLAGVMASEAAGRQTFVLCPERLDAHAAIRDLAPLSTVKASTPKAQRLAKKRGGDVVRERIRHLVFDAGTALAAPAAQILRVLTPPKTVTPYRSSPVPGVVGVFRLEDSPVVYVDLARRLGLRSPDDGLSRILLVGVGQHRIGFAVHGVQGVETSEWRRSADQAGDTGTIVQLGRGPNRRIVPALDLARLAASLVVP